MQQKLIFFWTAWILAALTSSVVDAQRVRLPQTAITTNEFSDGLVPVTPRSVETNFARQTSAVLGQPTFDPYSTGPDTASSPPSLFGTQPSAPLGGNTTPYWQSPAPGVTTVPSYGAPGATYPPNGYPQQPPILFPDGLNIPQVGNGFPQPLPGQYMRLFQEIRFRYTWVAGEDSPREMDTNDVELGTTINFPNFLWSGQPIHVSPVFTFHFWDGPDGDPVLFPTALPSRAYSAFIDFGWAPMITPMLGADLDVSVGVYSDFKKVRSDSVRIQGTGLLILGLTPTLTLKGGVNFIDRVDLKLLPAFGVLWMPNPQTRFDIFFPRPKLAQYLTTIGNTDVWWYLNGEYGGGSWTVERAGVVDRRMDINDIRVGGGLEWTGYTGVRGFVEAAYVFDRELVFAGGPAARELEDSVMVRGGLAY